jgi:dethiobiotin synthetase
VTKGFFITGTGTDIGKTLVTCALTSQLRAQGQQVLPLKPVASGVEPDALGASDPGQILQSMGRTVSPEGVAASTPWLYKAPLAPNMAAKREGGRIDFDEIISFCRARIDRAKGPVLIEGVGGVMAPITDDHLVIDWMVALELPAVLVAGAYLGTISHILSAVEVLKSRKLALASVIISDQGDGPVSPAELIDTLGRFLPDTPIGGFGPAGPGPQPWTRVPPIVQFLAS